MPNIKINACRISISKVCNFNVMVKTSKQRNLPAPFWHITYSNEDELLSLSEFVNAHTFNILCKMSSQ